MGPLTQLSPAQVRGGAAPRGGGVHVTAEDATVVRPEPEDADMAGLIEALAAAQVRHLRLELVGRVLPDALGALRHLESLELVAPRLAGLPSALGQLRSLRRLRVEAFHLLSLPRSIEQLVGLEALYIDSHHLTRMPKRLGALRSLRSFGWVLRDHYYPKDWEKHFYFKARLEQPVSEVFEQLALPRGLETLYLSEPPRFYWYAVNGPIPDRRFSALPDALSRFPALRTLILEDCGAVELPAGLVEHATLERVWTRGSRVVGPAGLEEKVGRLDLDAPWAAPST